MRAAFLLPLVLTACVSGAVHEPLPDSASRATPLAFGTYVTPDPDQNPIDPPERFTGYHVAVDYEVSAEELEKDVPVYAVCSGEVVYSGLAEGYGGALVHTCRLQQQVVTVLYGHLSVASLPPQGQRVRAGQQVAVLAPADSADSGFTRKHLHLGIRKGEAIDFRGYVQSPAEMNDFINPADFLPSAWVDATVEKPYWRED